ncbi:MAG: 2-C-methyl-D-erythritol 4-phosphate cytidylyltransferase [Planctomycetota bacterium]|nr:2-C-methyl-D-erythritol 4-phosphate cytidylyltransferase [Planctomycetota bacterium]
MIQPRRDHAPVPTSAAVIVAAGNSTRMGGKVRKPYLKLRGEPILVWTLRALARVPGLKQLVIVTRPEDRRRAQQAARQAKLPKRIAVAYADGGARRQDSVLHGLRAADGGAELVLIHDAARPFPPAEPLRLALEAAAREGAAILAQPVRDTLKKEAAAKAQAHPVSTQTVPRAGLWQAQTPQVFRRRLILDLSERLAKRAPKAEVTDDAAVCERFGQPVVLIESSSTNLKITRPEDVAIAEAFLKLGLVR